MNITTLAAEIARRVPDMARDSATNNETLIAGLLRAELERFTAEAIRRLEAAHPQSRLAVAVARYNAEFNACLALPCPPELILSMALIAQERGRDDIASELREAIA